nr:MAG TPA: NinB recombination protein [Crassvirales sp.]
MALYDTSNPLDNANFMLRAKKLAESGKIVELAEKKPKRSLNQNAYCHLAISYFASQYGCTLEWAKAQYFKKLVNPDLFIREKEDKFLGKVKYLRSSADLDVTEMSLAIDRWRNWCSIQASIYIPNVDDYYSIQLMEVEIKKNEKYL